MCRARSLAVLALALLATGGRTAVATDQAVPGTKLVLKQTTRGKMTFSAKGAIVAPTPGDTDDPTLAGGSFNLFNPTSGESATFDLPAGNWTTNGPQTIFKFKNKDAPAPPSEVKVALIKQGKSLKVQALATGITLDEPTQGSIGVVLTVGTTRYCALFGGTIMRDEPGAFIAKNAPPAPCPTTTTTSTSTTTSTLPPDCPPPPLPVGSVTFVIGQGTTDCGGPRITPGPVAPFTGEIDDAMGTKLRDLGLGCLYLGGGQNGGLKASGIPAGGSSVLSVSSSSGTSVTLAASHGHGPSDCTLGAGPLRHCVNGNGGTDGAGTCFSDANCAGQPGACLLDANCAFGPPLGVATTPPGLSTCVVNTFANNACGVAELSSGSSTLNALLSTRLYLTGDGTYPCPECVSGTCSSGARAGMQCSGTGTSGACPPSLTQYIGALSVSLSPLTTGETTVTEPSGLFCPGQTNPGAFGRFEARTIRQAGVPSSTAPTLAGIFCIPQSGSGLVDGVLDLPGPGTVSVSGSVTVGP